MQAQLGAAGIDVGGMDTPPDEEALEEAPTEALTATDKASVDALATATGASE
jgi:hypothetical protein